jgi:hypothetical protein
MGLSIEAINEQSSDKPSMKDSILNKSISISQEQLTEKFANAVARFEISEVAQLLSENGEYNWMKRQGELVDAGTKQGFLSWLSERFAPYIFTGSQQLSYEFDQCIFCRVGNPMVLFEAGHFPVQPIDPFDRDKQGLMLEFENDIINRITFCVGFLNTENDCQYQYCRDRVD